MKLKLLLIFFLIATITSCRSKRFIYDRAKILNEQEYSNLDSLLKLYNAKSGSEIVIYTQTKIVSGKDKYAYTVELAKDIGIGDKGLNNGALIFFSLEDRFVQLQLGHGFEWAVSDDTTALIVDSILKQFRDAQYGKGLYIGTEKLIKLTDSCLWDVNLEKSGVAKINEIVVEVDVKLLEKNSEYIMLTTNKYSKLKLNITKHMTSLVNKILEKGSKAIVYYRITSTEKSEGNLLGVE